MYNNAKSRSSPRGMTPAMSRPFFAEYTSKDLILYALAIGYAENDLKFVFEHHPDFQAVPTFPLALGFWANSCVDQGTNSNGRMHIFPPSMMRELGLLPEECNKAASDMPFEGPVLHTWQSIRWHQTIPVPKINRNTPAESDVPVTTTLTSRTLSVIPKNIGTFVTSETHIALKSTKELLCTLQATSLLLGMPKDDAILMVESNHPKQRVPDEISIAAVPSFRWRYQVSSTQALLYRLGSGDSNEIHVDSSAAMMLGGGNDDDDDDNNNRPILHGLCTLAIATRAILDYLDQHTTTLIYLEGRFAKPVFVGDALIVSLWDDPEGQSIQFQVMNEKSGKVVIDRGYVEYENTRKDSSSPMAARL